MPIPGDERSALRRSVARAALVAWVSMLLFVAASPAVAQGEAPSEPPAWAYRIAHDLMSPFCPGRTLAECPSPQADQLRLWILTQAAAGASQEEVEESLIGRFGEQILAAPRAEGWGLAAYAFPFGGFLLGGLFVFWAIRRLASPPPTATAGGSEAPARPPVARGGDAELERLLDEELGRG